MILEYFMAFYPILLIFLTWLWVELHDRNFRPLVLAWRPFHQCFVKLRREWNTKNDLIDVFITFFILSYNKFATLAVLMLFTNERVLNIKVSGSSYEAYEGTGVDTTSELYIFVLIAVVTIVIVYNIYQFYSFWPTHFTNFDGVSQSYTLTSLP